uniref:Integrator complex subunit 2 n=1 Tax=Ditylenchus dipsaci TaxID=166011 RepID=A0A915ET39_9BILA
MQQSSNLAGFNKSFLQMEPMEKVLYVCAHLISRMQFSEVINDAVEKFEPFDIEHCSEEVAWIISLITFFIPDIFQLEHFSSILLNYQNGPKLIALFLLNQSESFDLVLERLLSLKPYDENGYLAKQRHQALFQLFQLQPDQAERYLSDLLCSENHLNLVVKMLCSTDIFQEQFVVDTLIAHLTNKTGLFTTYITKTHRPSMKRIVDRVTNIMAKIDRNNDELNERVILLICLISSYPSSRLSATDCQHWILFLTTCPNLVNNQRDEIAEKYLIVFFQWIRDLATSSEHSSLSQLMLLVAIHMNTNKGDELSRLLSSVLGFKVNDTLRKLVTVKTLYLQHAVTDRDVAEKAAKLGVTKDLSANTSGYLPVHCINHLLSSRTFSKHQIPIQNWIKNQIKSCALPIHPVMTNLLQSFSDSCIPAPISEDQPNKNYNDTIDEAFFEEIFSADLFDETVVVKQVLSLFYLLHFTYKLDTSPISKMNLGSKQPPTPYSQKLWAKVPIRYLLLLLDERPAAFQHIRNICLRFIGVSMPHMLPTMNVVLEDGLVSFKLNPNDVHVSPVAFRASLENMQTDVSSFSVYLNQIDSSSLQEQYVRIWQRFENLIPRRLYQDTLQVWLNTPQAAVSGIIQVDNELLLAETPLILFRVDERIFKSPPHFLCLMHMLSFYLDASKNANHIRLLKAKAQHTSKSEIEEKSQLLKSYIGTQYLAVVQLLLELCDDTSNSLAALNGAEQLEEIKKIACGQIHQMFIADSLLPKLVHFNTYPLRLIPIMVKGVPSAHVLIGFIGELLTSANLERRIFGIVLMAELTQQYKIPTAFSGASLISDVLDTLLSCSITEQHIVLFNQVVPALASLIKVSPFTAPSLLDTLQRVRQIALSRIAVYASIVAAQASPEKSLLAMVEKTMEDCERLQI